MEDKIDLIFDLLKKWRNLPTYQLERRLDIFFVAYMKEIIEVYNEKHETKIKIDDGYSNFIPEFILKKGEETNRSNHADYAIINDENGKKKLYLIELKTDNNSIDTYDKEDEKGSQFKYYKKAKKDGFKKIVEDIIKIYSNPKCNAKKKYEQVIIKFNNLKIIEKREGELKPSTNLDDKVEIIYIIPNKDDKKIESKKQKLKVICDEDNNIIDFNDIKGNLKGNDELTIQFCDILERIYKLYKTEGEN